MCLSLLCPLPALDGRQALGKSASIGRVYATQPGLQELLSEEGCSLSAGGPALLTSLLLLLPPSLHGWMGGCVSVLR